MCGCAPGLQLGAGPIPPLSRPCNAFPCDMYLYDVGSWGRCVAPAKQCGLGNLTRARQCVNDLTFAAPDVNCSGVVQLPPNHQQCDIPELRDRLQTAVMDCSCTADIECPGGTTLNAQLEPNGKCDHGWCVCNKLFTGGDCMVELPIPLPGCEPEGRRDARGQCKSVWFACAWLLRKLHRCLFARAGLRWPEGRCPRERWFKPLPWLCGYASV